MAKAFSELSVAEIQAGLVAKEFSAQEIAKNSFERIAATDSSVHAYLETTENLALEAAAGPAGRKDPAGHLQRDHQERGAGEHPGAPGHRPEAGGRPAGPAHPGPDRGL